MNKIVDKITMGGSDRALGWSATLERGLVHRVAVAEVLLTDARASGEGEFLVAAQWPRAHCTFDRSGDGRHNPLMVAETLRQIGICLPTLFYGIAVDAHILIKDLAFDIDPGREPRSGYGATDVVCQAAADEVVRHPKTGSVRGMRLTVAFQEDGRIFAAAGGRARFLSADLYVQVRGRPVGGDRPGLDPRDQSPVGERPDADAVGVPTAGDVMVAMAGDGSAYVSPADPRHPFFFDHFSDHVPGMVLLEAARQTVALRSGARLVRPTGGSLAAERFTELAAPALVECEIDGDASAFRVLQSGAQTAAGRLSY